jgi:hypothetical protein
MLCGIEFGAVRGLLYQPYVLGNFQPVRSVPSRSIYQHDDKVFLEISGDFLQEQVHHVSVGVGQDQRGDLAQDHAHCRIDIKECPGNLLRNSGPDTFGRPAFANIGDPSESSFVLGHDFDGSGILWVSVFDNLGYKLREVFLKAS